MAQLRRYTFKLYPTARQAARLHEIRFMVADLWNALLERREAVYRQEGRNLSLTEMQREITRLRRERPEWQTFPWNTADMVARRLDRAYQAFFRRLKDGEDAPGYPKGKTDSRHIDSIPLRENDGQRGWRFEHWKGQNKRQWRLHLSGTTNFKNKVEWIRARGILPCDPKDWGDATIIWHGRRWWLSVVVEIERSRKHGARKSKIDFQPITVRDFVRVNGLPEYPPGLAKSAAVNAAIDRLNGERDKRFPLGSPRSDDDERVFRSISRRIARLHQKATFVRQDALHKWTTAKVARASDLTVIHPELEQHTGKGDPTNWGANVKPVAMVNRHSATLAIGAAVQMLTYKAGEAGIRCEVEVVASKRSQFTAAMVRVGRQSRRAARIVRKEGRE
jgi:putative transposase